MRLEPVLVELVWGFVAQGLVGPHGVAGVFPGQELLVQGGHLRGEVSDFVELLRMGALCPFHASVWEQSDHVR